MKTTVTEYDFVRAFEAGQYKDNFSYNGLIALFDHLEEYETFSGEQIELDVVALCCNYVEYPSMLEAYHDMVVSSEESTEESARAYFEENTTIIDFDSGVILHNF